MFPRDALDPWIADDILRVINSEKTQVEVACVKSGRGEDAEKDYASIELPWARQNRRISTTISYCVRGFIALFRTSRMPRICSRVRRALACFLDRSHE